MLLVLGGLASAYASGLFDQLQDPARAAQRIQDLGIWGGLAFVAVYTLVQPFGIPGTVFVMAAPLIWPWPVAFGLSMLGTLGASSVGFLFARFVARDWIAQRVPERLRRYEEALEKRAFVTVVSLRLIFWMPPMLHAFFGVSRVRFWTHLWGSALGYLLPLFLMSFFGQQVFDWIKELSPSTWAALGVSFAVLVLTAWMWRRRLVRSAG